VLVVCTGNLCRSPLVEALLRAELELAGLDAMVTSAGTRAPEGLPPDRKLITVAEELDVDVADHRSRPLSADLLANSDLVLTMTRRQVREVIDIDPAAAALTVPLRRAVWKSRSISRGTQPFTAWAAGLVADVPESEWPRSSHADDVPDPIGRPIRHYRAMGRDVDDLVRTLVRHWSGRSSA
jgi:protein-tyrosine phosphatase